MKFPFYVIGDVHERHPLCHTILKKLGPDSRIIWLGDFFDGKIGNQETYDLVQTCLLLNDIAKTRPQDVIITGNHDVAYLIGHEKYYCYGCTRNRKKAFDTYLSKEARSKFQFFYNKDLYDKRVVFSHAGFRDDFSHKFGGWKNVSNAQKFVKLSVEQAKSRPQDDNPLFDSGRGPNWVRWSVLGVSEEICNVLGHTPSEDVQFVRSEASGNWSLNCDSLKGKKIVKFDTDGIYVIDLRFDTETLIFDPKAVDNTNFLV